MSSFYSPSKQAFFDDCICAPPPDAVPITAEEMTALFEAQSKGQVIQPGSDGTPEAVDPTIAPPSVANLLAYANAKQNAVMAEVWTFDVGQGGASKKVSTRLDDKGQAAMTQIALWAATSGQTPGATIPYSNVDYTAETLSPAEASALSLQKATAVKLATYAILNQLATAIMAVPPTITTMAEIDAAAWPSPVSA